MTGSKLSPQMITLPVEEFLRNVTNFQKVRENNF